VPTVAGQLPVRKRGAIRVERLAPYERRPAPDLQHNKGERTGQGVSLAIL
jgi:hypothetical protein